MSDDVATESTGSAGDRTRALARLMVVDDVRLNRRLLASQLAKRGYAVEELADGPAALQAIESAPCDLMLLDIEMPGMDGFEVLRRVRRTRTRVELPIIMLTGREDSADVVMALSEGANDYILKRDDVRVVFARVEAQLQLKQAMDGLQQARRLEAVGNLAAGLAHEINTPLQFIGDNAAFVEQAVPRLLTVLRHQTELLTSLSSEQRAALEAAQKKARVDVIERQLPEAVAELLQGVARVAEVVSAMKAYVQPSGGAEGWTSLPELMQMASTVARSAWRPVASLTVELEDAPSQIYGDAQALGESLVALLLNAAQALADQGSTDGQIVLCARSTIAGVQIQVKDDGPGIPLNLQQRIFDPFFTTREVGQGSGQGLAVCHAVVRRHGGNLEVHSTPGQGATFTITLPQRPQD